MLIVFFCICCAQFLETLDIDANKGQSHGLQYFSALLVYITDKFYNLIDPCLPYPSDTQAVGKH